MSLHSVIIQGPINTKLSYSIGRIFNIEDGEWEIAVASLNLSYTSRIPRAIIGICVNYVQTQFVKNNSIEADEEIIGITCIGNKNVGEKYTIAFRRDFFVVNRPSQVLTMTIKSVEGEMADFDLEGAYVVVNFLLRRIR